MRGEVIEENEKHVPTYCRNVPEHCFCTITWQILACGASLCIRNRKMRQTYQALFLHEVRQPEIEHRFPSYAKTHFLSSSRDSKVSLLDGRPLKNFRVIICQKISPVKFPVRSYIFCNVTSFVSKFSYTPC